MGCDYGLIALVGVEIIFSTVPQLATDTIKPRLPRPSASYKQQKLSKAQPSSVHPHLTKISAADRSTVRFMDLGFHFSASSC